ncbi:uncharacterized protein TNCV_2077661 [Trichonephila clavipes]|nr:uncharacterized protein TNCV_2077661 [Trichonephila clavipes]
MYVKWTALRATANPPIIPLSGECEEKQMAMTWTEEAVREEILEHMRRVENAREADAQQQKQLLKYNESQLELTAVDEDLPLLEVRLESLEVRIQTILNSSKKSSSGAVMKTNDNFEIKPKIPPLVLPEFSGKYEGFSSFKIQFDDLITNNILLSESQKLYYLRSCLTHWLASS